MFSQRTIEQLGYYVYSLIDPFTTNIFYIGKGTGNRVYSHQNDALESEDSTDKLDYIRDIISRGGKIQHEIIRHGLDEKTAFEVEGALIDIYGLDELKNAVNGHGHNTRGLQPDIELEVRYGSDPIQIEHRVFLAMVSGTYDPFTTPDDHLYEVARKWWRVNPSRHDAEYALAVHKGIIRGIYRITGWEKAVAPYSCPEDKGRFAFIGEIADQELIDQYLYGDISDYITQNAKWVNC
jgi:hypothetical protein